MMAAHVALNKLIIDVIFDAIALDLDAEGFGTLGAVVQIDNQAGRHDRRTARSQCTVERLGHAPYHAVLDRPQNGE